MTSTSESIGILEEAQRREKEFAARLGIERAVLSAPMTGTAGAKLVAAVSAAGGLGVLPTGGDGGRYPEVGRGNSEPYG